MRPNLNFSCIYCIINNLNGKIYIGSTVDFKHRKFTHIRQLKNNTHHAIALQRAINKYGIDNFTFEVVETVSDRTKLIEREQHWMNFFKPEYNCSPTAGSCLGVKFTEEGKQHAKDRQLRLWKDPDYREMMTNKTKQAWQNPETRENMLSTRNMSKLRTPEAIEKQKESRKNSKYKHSTDTINRMRETRMKNGIGLIPIIRTDVCSNEIKHFAGISIAAREMNCGETSIRNNVFGRTKLVQKRYKFERL